MPFPRWGRRFNAQMPPRAKLAGGGRSRALRRRDRKRCDFRKFQIAYAESLRKSRLVFFLVAGARGTRTTVGLYDLPGQAPDLCPGCHIATNCRKSVSIRTILPGHYGQLGRDQDRLQRGPYRDGKRRGAGHGRASRHRHPTYRRAGGAAGGEAVPTSCPRLHPYRGR